MGVRIRFGNGCRRWAGFVPRIGRPRGVIVPLLEVQYPRSLRDIFTIASQSSSILICVEKQSRIQHRPIEEVKTMEGNGRRLGWIAIALGGLALFVALSGRAEQRRMQYSWQQS